MFDRILFTYGFRVFFLFGGIAAAVLIPIWVVMLQGVISAPGYLGAVGWHGHELIFGYSAAVIAGFLLTAVANWTGTANIKGAPLALLAAFWLAGRLALLFADALPGPLVALADLLFLPGVALVLLPALLKAGRFANTAFTVLLGLMAVANLIIHLEALGYIDGFATAALYAALDLVLLIMVMVGGRITPAFTRNALGTQPVLRPAADKAAVTLVLAVAAADLVAAPNIAIGLLCLAAALANGIRLSGWGGMATLKTPILWILHLAYLWVVVGFALRGIAALTDFLPMATALHALTLGAVGSLTLGMMTRVALGHTGRPLDIRPVIPWTYAAVSAAALIRIIVPSIAPGLSVEANYVAGLLWTAAFSIFVVVYAPVLLSPRPDGRPG